MILNILYNIGYWIFHFTKYVAFMLAAGTFLGAFIFPIVGNPLTNLTTLYLIKKGAWCGFKYAGVWAGGSSIVFCIIKAHNNYIKKHGTPQ